MAENVFLFLKADGTHIQGDSTVTSLDRENSIECIEYHDSVQTQRESSTGMASGERVYSPIRIVKRLDRSTPLLFKALTNNEVIEAEIKFYRPSPTGDGTSEHFFTVQLREARIATIERVNPNTVKDETSMQPAYEEVSFVFGYISTTYEEGGIEHVDHWSARF